MSERQRRWERTRTFVTLGWMTLLFVVTGLAFAVATPLFQNADESSHIDLARYYARHPTQMAGPSLRQTQGSRAAIVATGLRDEALAPNFSNVPDTRPDYRPFTEYGGGNAAEQRRAARCRARATSTPTRRGGTSSSHRSRG